MANILGDAGLFFQRPDVSEYDRSVKYLNPMYLLRPGEDMPRVANGTSVTSAPGQPSDGTNEEELGELEKSRVFRIFDEATVLDASFALDVTQSSRIVSVLKEYVAILCLISGWELTEIPHRTHSHQIEALATMVEREKGSFNPQSAFPLLWKATNEGGRTKLACPNYSAPSLA